MTLVVPDVNILIYAFRTDSADHEKYAGWLNGMLRSGTVGLTDTILSGFVRIVTHPRIYPEPTPPAAAFAFVRRLIDEPRSEWLQQGSVTWSSLDMLVTSDAGIRGNLVPDAYIAALCLANGAQLATRDRGFARFPGLRWFDPAKL